MGFWNFFSFVVCIIVLHCSILNYYVLAFPSPLTLGLAVSIRWTDSGLDCGTGLWDWTQKVALTVSSDSETIQEIYSFQLTDYASF